MANYYGSWKSSSNRSTNYRRSATTRGNNFGGTTWSPNSPKFNTAKNECETRIGSYENIYSQFTGSGATPVSPSTANKFIKYVDNGNRVYKFNNAQFSRYFGNSMKNTTPTVAFRYLKQKFGGGIKAVCRGKGNNWLICASPNVSGRAFTSYNWK